MGLVRRGKRPQSASAPPGRQLPLVFERWGSLSFGGVTVLLVIRIPLLDFRPFAADDEIYRGVRLPGSWSEGEFVRGTGVIRKRPRHSISDWPAERTYADFKNSVRLPAGSVEDLNSRFQTFRVECFHRRLWYAMPETYCMFDYDFAVPFQSHARGMSGYRGSFKQPLSTLAGLPEAFLKSPITVGPWIGGGERPTTPLAACSKRLARHFATATANSTTRESGVKLVEAGRPVIAIEGTGILPTLDLPQHIDRYEFEDIEVLGFMLSTRRGKSTRCYCIFSRHNSRASLRKVREFRVHLLRLHSIHEFLAHLANRAFSSLWGPSDLATERSVAYDRLQRAVVEICQIMRRAENAKIGPTPNLLSAAFLAHEFITDYSLAVLERRLLASVRPAVLRKLRQLADEESERAQLDRILEASRDRSGVLTIIGKGANVTKYDMRGSNIGAAGDNATVSNFAQGQEAQVLVIDGHDVDRFKLVSELRELRESISQSQTQDRDTNSAHDTLAEAEDAARRGNGEQVKASLAKLGRWVLRLAEATGAAVAAEAIRRAAGL